MNTRQDRFLKIVVGICMTLISVYFIYRAVELREVQAKVSKYSLEDDPVSYFLFVGLYTMLSFLGVIITIKGLRNDI